MPQLTATPHCPLLIVDDHADTGRMLVAAARRRGIAAQATTTAVNTVEWIASNDARVVVLDEMMPDVSGLEALKKSGATLVSGTCGWSSTAPATTGKSSGTPRR